MTIIIILCILLLIAYVVDISSAYTKIPTIFLLLLIGMGIHHWSTSFNIQIPDLNGLLPILGTIGLILIVLESSLELELNKNKVSVIQKSFISSLLPMLILSFLISYMIHFYYNVPVKLAMINTLPLCVISSAIAIPSVKNISKQNKEFIVYESSLSDILGILFFNFMMLNDNINTQSFLIFGLQLIVILVASVVLVFFLSFLLSRINHHVSYTPIILLVILIYYASKIYHLPGLLFILVFGLFLGNLDELKQYKFIAKLKPEKLDTEVVKFKEITYEASFIVRALFFILFGFLIDINEVADVNALPLSIAIVTLIVIVRWITLKLLKTPIVPVLYIAPRGLITILLFLSILPQYKIPYINNACVIQVIILSVLLMMIGLMKNKDSVAIANTNN